LVKRRQNSAAVSLWNKNVTGFLIAGGRIGQP